MSEDSQFLESCYEALLSYSEVQLLSLVRRVVFRLQRLDATGLFGDQLRFKSLWDEYCYEVQNGPHQILETAWEHTLEGIIDEVVRRIPEHEARVLTVFATLEFSVIDDGTIWRDGIRDVVQSELRATAAKRDLRRLAYGGATAWIAF